MTTTTSTADLHHIEDKLDEFVTAAVDHGSKNDPVATSLRKSIRALGQEVFDATQSVVALIDVMERVADRDPKRPGARTSVMEQAWAHVGAELDGIGYAV